MAQLDKLKAAFKACNGPFRFSDFERLLRGLGYERTGKASGSGRKYFNKITGHLIMLHEPHSGEMGRGMVRRLQEELEGKGLLG